MKKTYPSLLLLVVLAVCAGGVAWSRSAPTLTLPARVDLSILQLLDHSKVVDKRPDVPGYDRGCGSGEACVFGQAWADVDRNGCDTRNDVLKQQLQKETVITRTGSRGCVVISGDGRDPYSGGLIRYRKTSGDGDHVEIDHVYPLALAWDMGANTWSQERRREFANDQLNLKVALQKTNRAKSDKTPAEWTEHIAPTLRCDYVKTFLNVALAYALPITRADAESIRSTANTCV
jgi:hypothetical protein